MRARSSQISRNRARRPAGDEPSQRRQDNVAVDQVARPAVASSHGAVLSWDDRGDDILAESNYHCALSLITCAAGDDADEHVIDASASHWLTGSRRTIYVQVFDENDDFTDAWFEAVGIMLGLQDYPVLDESDYSEREHGARLKNVDEARRWVERRHDWDSDVDRDAVFASMHDALSERCGYDGSGEVSWSWFEDTYERHRDAYFDGLGEQRSPGSLSDGRQSGSDRPLGS